MSSIIRRREILKNGILPGTLKQCLYIESSSEQNGPRITTEVYYNTSGQTLFISSEFMWNSIRNCDYVIGVYDNNKEIGFRSAGGNNSEAFMNVKTSGYTSLCDKGNISSNIWYKLNFNYTGTTSICTYCSKTNTKTLELITLTVPFNLFDRNKSYEESGSDYTFYGKMKTTTITVNGEEHIFIPCYSVGSMTGWQGSTSTTVASGTVGMYDTYNKKFYVKSGGSGSFTAGPDV